MKHVITLLGLMLVLALTSCATTRKLEQSTIEERVENTSTQEEAVEKTVTVVDTTRTEHGKVTITEIVFDTTTPDPVVDSEKESSHGNHGKTKTESKPTPPAASVSLPGIGNINGNIKSIRQTVIESDVEQKGESKDSKEQKESKCNASAIQDSAQSNTKSAPAPDPQRWRYIFYILAIGVVMLLYLKRVPILDWLKRILSGLRRIF